MPETKVFSEQIWRGVDYSIRPELLPPGGLQAASNVYFDDAGRLCSRPRLINKLTADVGSVSYMAVPYYKANGDTYIVYSLNGSIYTWKKGDTTATAVSALGAFTADLVQFCQIGDFVFIAGAADGKMRRFIPGDASSVMTAPGLLQPTYSTTAALTNSTISTLLTTANWSADTFASNGLTSVAKNAGGSGYVVGEVITLAGGTFTTPAQVQVVTRSGTAVLTVMIVNPGAYSVTSATFTQGSTTGAGTGATFNAGVFGTTVGTAFTIPDATFAACSTSGVTPPSNLSSSWNVTAGTVEATGTTFNPLINQASYVRFDDPGSAIKSVNYVTNLAKTNANGLGAGARKALKFLVTINFYAKTPSDTIDCTFIGDDGTGADLYRQTKTFSAFTANTASETSLIFSFSGTADDITITRFKLLLTAGQNNTSGATNGAYGWNIRVSAIEPIVTYTQSTTGQSVDIAASVLNNDSTTIYVGDNRLTYSVGSATDLSKVNQYALAFRSLIPLGDYQVRLMIKESTGGTEYYSPYLTVATTADGTQYLPIDISQITAANRDAVLYIAIVFTGDVPVQAGTAFAGQKFLTVGPFTKSGNLSIDFAPYEWAVIEERITAGTPYYQTSSPRSDPPTIGLSPTSYLASGSIVLSSATLTDSNADRMTIIRRGGTFPDGLWRRIATFAPGSNASDTTNGYWTWTNSTKTFVDNTPDQWLISAKSPSPGDGSAAAGLIYLEHDYTPSNIVALAARDGRVIAVVEASGGTEFWVSGLTNISNGTGLYWNQVNTTATTPGAVNIVSPQGWYKRLSGSLSAALGQVQRVVPYFESALLFLQNAVYVFGGNDFTDYYLRRFEGDDGRGLIAKRAITVAHGKVYYLAADGLREMTAQGSKIISYAINDNLFHTAGNVVFTASSPRFLQIAKYSALAEFNGRLFLSLCGNGSSVASKVYVLDTRVPGVSESAGAWTTWDGFAASSMVNLASARGVGSSAFDANELYFLSAPDSAATGLTGGGQIYLVSDPTGYDTGAGGTVNFTPTIQSRKFHEQGFALRASQIGWMCAPPPGYVSPNLTYTVSVNGDGNATIAGQTASTDVFTQSFTTFWPNFAARRIAVSQAAQGQYIDWTLTLTSAGLFIPQEVQLTATLMKAL